MPMAAALPGASFAGIDTAPGAIDRARRLVDALGLDNVVLEERAIEDFAPERGGFDYVIAHGVYSWVPPAARDRLLGLCREALAEGGVAYVSYNALPGWRVRQALRDILRFHTAATEDPREQIEEARALMQLLLEGWPLVRTQVEQLLSRSGAGLLHDELAPDNEPVYFVQFVEHAGRHGLQYLAEADFFEMQIGVASERITAALLEVDDPVRREQYLDFLKGRMFRQTLLCHAEEPVDRTPRPTVIEGLAVSTEVRWRDGAFVGPTGSRLTTDNRAVVAALERAAAAWPAAVWVRDLIGPADAPTVCDALLRAYAANLVALHVHPPPLTTTPGDTPSTTALVRHQGGIGDVVTNLRHTSVRIEDDLGRHLVTLLDGTRDRAALAADLGAFLTGRGDPVPDNLRESLDRSLEGLGRLALLQG